jgi:hypothetical protein
MYCKSFVREEKMEIAGVSFNPLLQIASILSNQDCMCCLLSRIPDFKNFVSMSKNSKLPERCYSDTSW